MTKLNTYLPLEVIMKSKKLLSIWIIKYNLPKLLPMEHKANQKLYENSKLTIADIIENIK